MITRRDPNRDVLDSVTIGVAIVGSKKNEKARHSTVFLDICFLNRRSYHPLWPLTIQYGDKE